MSDLPPEFRKRRVGWWWIILGFIGVALVASPFLARAIRIAGVPDVAEPFDLVAARHVEVAPGDNAFDIYRQAAQQVAGMSTAVNGAFVGLSEDPETAMLSKELLLFLDSQREMLNLFRLGSERPEAVYHQPDDYRVNTLIEVTQQLRQMCRLAEVEALRLELEGDVDGAWSWHRTTLRASRHSGLHGCLIERLVGCAVYGQAAEGLARWSARPGVDQERLRTALGELREINRSTVPLSRPLQVEYLSMMKTISDPALRSQLVDMSGLGRFAFEAQCRLSEPDVSQRTARLLFTNWLSQCDLPRQQRAATIAGIPPVFDVTVGGQSGSPAVSPQEVQKLLQSAPIARLLLPAVAASFNAHDREAARQVLLETALALQIWYRQHGEFPGSLAPRVGTLLDSLPVDPFGKGEPIRYRRETDASRGATIWSIGDDEVDNDGLVDINKASRREGDVVISVKPPIHRTGAP